MFGSVSHLIMYLIIGYFLPFIISDDTQIYKLVFIFRLVQNLPKVLHYVCGHVCKQVSRLN